VGSTISVRGIPRVVVGVVPDGRSIPTGGDLWLPLPRDLDRGLSGHMSSRVNRSNRGLQVLGLLAPTVTIDQARSEYDALERELVREHPADDAGLTTKITPLREVYVGFARPMLVAMLAATLLVLLVACANVAGIQLARATSRVREIAVRSAIGAGRARVLRQLLTESVMLALAGGALGIALAYRSSEFAEVAVLGQSPSWLMPSVDVRVLAFAVTVSMLTGIVFGVAPAMRLTRVDPADALRGGRSALGGGPSRGRLQQLFVVVQMALSIVLVVAAGLSIESVRRVEELPLGFDERRALMFTATLQTPRYDVAGERARFADALDRRASGLPGVTIAGATSLPPFRCCSKWALGIDGQPLPDDQKLMVPGNSVTPGYFEAMGIPLVRGRAFAGTDAADAAPVMVINESFAHRFWPYGDAIGHLVHDGNDHATIVGIVRDVKIVLTEPPGPQFYRPFAQKPVTTLTFVLRTPTGDPARFTADIRRIVHDLDPTLPLYGFTTASTMVDFQFAGRRTFESLMIAFGVIALLLATMGIYGVTSFFVSQRRGSRAPAGTGASIERGDGVRGRPGRSRRRVPRRALVVAHALWRWRRPSSHLRRCRGTARGRNTGREHRPGQPRRARRPDDDAARRVAHAETRRRVRLLLFPPSEDAGKDHRTALNALTNCSSSGRLRSDTASSASPFPRHAMTLYPLRADSDI
jgi:predicted permease